MSMSAVIESIERKAFERATKQQRYDDLYGKESMREMSMATAMEQAGVPKTEFERMIGLGNSEKICKAISRGNRVEIVPVKNGVKVLEVKRKEI